MSEYRLEVRGVTKVFPGTRALDQVQLQVRPGEVHALCWEIYPHEHHRRRVSAHGGRDLV